MIVTDVFILYGLLFDHIHVSGYFIYILQSKTTVEFLNKSMVLLYKPQLAAELGKCAKRSR